MALRIVIDTNILLVSISSKSPYYWIFEGLRNNEYDLIVSTDIMLEYEEIIEQHMGSNVSENVCNALERFPNVHFIQRYYRWQLIKEDPDDNKFVDCAIAGDADYLVTNDRHFRVLDSIEFPRISVIDPQGFKIRLDKTL